MRVLLSNLSRMLTARCEKQVVLDMSWLELIQKLPGHSQIRRFGQFSVKVDQRGLRRAMDDRLHTLDVETFGMNGIRRYGSLTSVHACCESIR